MTRHVMSFDVEEYFHSATFDGVVPRTEWTSLPSRVEASTYYILDLLEQAKVHATFFVVSWVAERLPGLVRGIHEHGHEVASHGHAHQLVYQLTPAAFADDISRARNTLSDIIGAAVLGYRAPSFSITRRSLWALEVLAQNGYVYDSSVFPIRHHRYGIPDFVTEPVTITTPSGPVDEYPMTIARFVGRRVPVSGGGYFRHLPQWMLWRSWHELTRAGRSSVFYLHPWELDPDQPRLQVGLFRRWRHYSGQTRARTELAPWLDAFAWTSFERLRAEQQPARVIALQQLDQTGLN